MKEKCFQRCRLGLCGNNLGQRGDDSHGQLGGARRKRDEAGVFAAGSFQPAETGSVTGESQEQSYAE